MLFFPLLFLLGLLAPTAVNAGPLSDGFQQRCKAFLQESASAAGGNSVWADLVRLALGPGAPGVAPFSGEDMRSSMANMAQRKDCSDFEVTGMIRMLWMYRNSSLWPPGFAEEVSEAIRGWQFWIDEANGFQGNMEFWTENHQMDFHTSEYLAGALFHDQFFPGTNMTGQQHMDKGRDFVRQWMERRYLWGFQEWKSETYLQFDVISLTNLASLSPEVEVSRRAAMVLDLLLYDLTIHAHKGAISSSRGRSYGDNKFSIANQGVSTLINLLSNQTINVQVANGPGVVVCLSELLNLHHVPEAILAVAADDPEELENKEHIGVDPTEASLAAEGELGYSQPNEGIVWWGMEAYAHPKTINLAFIMIDAWDLTHTNESIFDYFHILEPLRNTTELQLLCDLLWPATTSILGHINSYMYRTPDVSLASALDYRPGVIGLQQHAWQASCNGTALVFTTQRGPLSNPEHMLSSLGHLAEIFRAEGISVTKELGLMSGHQIAAASPQSLSQQLRDKFSPFVAQALNKAYGELGRDYADAYWTGSASLPRVGQYKDILIALYDPPYNGEPAFVFPPRTHAYFPKSQFDEVVDRLQDLGWILGRQGSGYIALHSSSTNITWQTKGEFIDREIIAEGGRAAWVCIVGREKVYGSFANFTAIILNTSVKAVLANNTNITISVTQPTGRAVTFGFERSDSFILEEPGSAPRVIPLDTVMRLDSPYAHALFPARGDLKIAFNDLSVTENFKDNVRTVVDAQATSGLYEHEEHKNNNDVLQRADVMRGLFPNTDSNATLLGLKMAEKIFQAWDSPAEAYPHFKAWGYEGGVIQLGLWELSHAVGNNTEIQSRCDAVLNEYMDKDAGLAFKILHDDKIIFPWGYSIGDHIALYPVAYAARVANEAKSPSDDDMKLCAEVAKRFVLGYPHRLEDGTVSRNIGWWVQDILPRNASAVWVDDSFMGTALVTHSLPFLDASVRDMYEDYVSNQVLLFLHHLRDPTTGLLHHGYDAARDKHSCCLWGRGNGWALMALTDLLLALPATHPNYAYLMSNYTALCTAVIRYQDLGGSGRWHNLLNDTEFELETSSSSFFLYALTKGLQRGWLPSGPSSPFTTAASMAWQGVSSVIDASDGTVAGIVGETGIKASAAGYHTGPMPYDKSAPGLGAVLRAVAAVAEVQTKWQ